MQTRKSEAVPPFLRDISIDPSSTLEYITTHISAIYTAARSSSINDEDIVHIDHDTYAKIYTAVFNYTRTPEKQSKAQQSSIAKGGILFRHLLAEIRGFCEYVRDEIFGVDSDDEISDEARARKILMLYMSCYGRFSRLSLLVKNLMGFWNRHWVAHQWALREIKVSSVEELHKMVWKEEVLENGGSREVVYAVAVLGRRGVRITEHDSVLVKDVVRSLSGLGVTLES